MKILYEYSRGCGKHINQDAYGYKDNILWVIDGATEVYDSNYFPLNDDVYWVVQTLNKFLREEDASLSLKDFVCNAINKVRNKAFEVAPTIATLDERYLPTYAIGCVKYNKGSLEYFFLGDCSLFVSTDLQTRYTDNRIEPFHLQVNAVKERYKNNKNKYNEEVIKKVREIKRFINVDEGYWIGNLNSEAAKNAIQGMINLQEGNKILLCTDGFRPNLDEAMLVSYEVADIFCENKLHNIICQQLETEKQYVRHTGIDISDDKTLILAQV